MRVKTNLKRSSINAVSSHACASWITSLGDKILHNAMEYRLVIVALHAQLDKVPARLRTFLRPQLNVDITKRGSQTDLSIDRRHSHNTCQGDYRMWVQRSGKFPHLARRRWLLDVNIAHPVAALTDKTNHINEINCAMKEQNL